MIRRLSVAFLGLCLSPAALAQSAPAGAPAPPPPSMAPPTSAAQSLDRQLGFAENDLLSLAEAMPADKYDFAPSGPGFKDVRTFKQQLGHVAATIYAAAASLLGEPPNLKEADLSGGPSGLRSKEDFVGYLKGAFAKGHKAIATVDEKNLIEVVGPKDGMRGTRLGLSNLMTWHTFDHYGQLVIYARMNGVVPPASMRK
ncbi:MAG TPA: DinB family protein [Anaeromyxobacteraceae bacterium]|nr:DinB family protein [Anaeromyxobacteraceae bacterium]